MRILRDSAGRVRIMHDPKLILPQEPRIPEEWRQRYQARSLGDLTKDVNELFAWKRTSGSEKDRMQKEILEAERYGFASLIFAILAFLMVCGLILWAAWPFWPWK